MNMEKVEERTMIKYVAKIGFKKIETVNVEKETEKSVWVNGIQSRKESSYENYFDTFSEAKQFLINKLNVKIGSLRANIDYYTLELNEILELFEE